MSVLLDKGMVEQLEQKTRAGSEQTSEVDENPWASIVFRSYSLSLHSPTMYTPFPCSRSNSERPAGSQLFLPLAFVDPWPSYLLPRFHFPLVLNIVTNCGY